MHAGLPGHVDQANPVHVPDDNSRLGTIDCHRSCRRALPCGNETYSVAPLTLPPARRTLTTIVCGPLRAGGVRVPACIPCLGRQSMSKRYGLGAAAAAAMVLVAG